MWKCRPSAWVWPGILAVGLLLLISMLLKSGSIENDLTKRALGKLSADHPWASVELDGRDLSISGVAPCLLYTSPSPRDLSTSRMPSSA